MTINKPVFIGIAGPSGAGKSSLCDNLKRNSRDYEHIRLDNYFKHPRTFTRKYGFANWEKPSNLKFNILLKHLNSLSRGKVVQTKSFPKKAGGKRLPITLKPRKYILVEGFQLFANKHIRDFLDKKIYLHLPVNLMLKRRTARFGMVNITDYDKKVAIPEFLRLGIQQKKFADFILDAVQPQKQILAKVKKLIQAN